MQLYSIPQLDRTGLCRTVYTSKEPGKWKFNEPGALENYAELGSVLGITPDAMVRPSQTHTSLVRAVGADSGGNGVVRPPDEISCDGLITDTPKLLLCTREADCVPVYLLDPVHKAVGMIHSGWRGTAKWIGARAIEEMNRHYNTKAEDLLAAFGPSICRNCYEVGPELQEDFSENFTKDEINALFTPKGNGKYLLDVAGAVRLCLLHSGLQDDRIFLSPLCTYENRNFSSYRREKNYDSQMLTGIMLL